MLISTLETTFLCWKGSGLRGRDLFPTIRREWAYTAFRPSALANLACGSSKVQNCSASIEEHRPRASCRACAPPASAHGGERGPRRDRRRIRAEPPQAIRLSRVLVGDVQRNHEARVDVNRQYRPRSLMTKSAPGKIRSPKIFFARAAKSGHSAWG
jgi:hypothetical protein